MWTSVGPLAIVALRHGCFDRRAVLLKFRVTRTLILDRVPMPCVRARLQLLSVPLVRTIIHVEANEILAQVR